MKQKFGSEEVLTTGNSKVSLFLPQTKNNTTARQSYAPDPMPQVHSSRQSSEEKRDGAASTPKAATNSRIQVMKEMFEKKSTFRSDARKQSIARGSKIAECKRQLGLTEVNSICSPIHKPSRSATPATASTTSSTESEVYFKDRIHKSRFADKKRMFERCFERHAFDATGKISGASGFTTNGGFSLEEAEAQVLSESERSSLAYSGSLVSEDNDHARDEVDVARPSYQPESRDMFYTAECTPVRMQNVPSKSSIEESFQEKLNQLVASFERHLRASEESAHLTSTMEDTAEIVDDIPMRSTGTSSSAKVALVKFSNAQLSPLEARQDLSSSQLLPDGFFFSTVEQVNQMKIEEQHVTKVESTSTRSMASTPIADNLKSSLPGHSLRASAFNTKMERAKADSTVTRRMTRNSVADNLKSPLPGYSSRGSAFSGTKKKRAKASLRQQYEAPIMSAISTTSWNSEQTSFDRSDQELSPLKNPCKMSIGARVHASLAESKRSLNVDTKSGNSPSKSCDEKTESQSTMTSSIVPSHVAVYDGSIHADAQDLQEFSEQITTMAKAAPGVIFDTFVDTADRVVVSPLISIFHCVDASEHILCNGSQQIPAGRKLKIKRSRRRKYQQSGSLSRSGSRTSKTK